jgi:hypothetical protein
VDIIALPETTSNRSAQQLPLTPGVIQLQQPPAGQQGQQATGALVTFTGTNFTGAAIQCDTEFEDSLQTIDTYAGNHNVQVHVTSSFRQQGQAVAGAVVTPVANSNHHAGHAIDINIRYQDTLDTSTQLHPDNFDSLPQPVQDFLNDIRNDTGLRWGGDFGTTDPVHIDDGLNVPDFDSLPASPVRFFGKAALPCAINTGYNG